MTTPPGVGPHPRGHGRPEPGHLAIGKAVAILCVAVAIGAYVIQLGGPKTVQSGASSPPTTLHVSPPSTSTLPATPNTTVPSTTTTTVPAVSGVAPSRSVDVVVANASQTDGAAGHYTTVLSKAGWGTLVPLTALASEQTSSVWYVSGEEKAAAGIASTLGISSTEVAPVSAATPVAGATHADVVVVIGDDIASSAVG